MCHRSTFASCHLWVFVTQGRTAEVKVSVDGKLWLSNAGSLFVNCTQHFGKGMRAMPAARLDDGKVGPCCWIYTWA